MAPFDKKVVPRVQASGTLWIMTLSAKIVISVTVLKTPIERPSTTLYRTKAIPKVVKLLGSNLCLNSFSVFTSFYSSSKSSYAALNEATLLEF